MNEFLFSLLYCVTAKQKPLKYFVVKPLKVLGEI